MIRPFGEAAFLVELDGSHRAQALAAALRADPPESVGGIVPGRASVLVEYDPSVAVATEVEADLRARLADAARMPPLAGRARRIPVVYGGEMGPDLGEVCAVAGLSREEVIELHASVELEVLFDGFAPGFAYLGDVAAALAVPRLATPRTRVPSGSVALADGMSGVYPAELPGGWRIIGRTPISVFDPHREPPAYLLPADRVRFEAIPATEWERRAGAPADW
jgi:KipI family sensor histidine kinase inhibitor